MVCFSSPWIVTSCTGQSGELIAICSAASEKASITSPTRKPARMLSWRGLSHTGHLQDADAQVFVGDADGLRRHRHEAMAGHARRRVDLEEPGLLLLVQHDVDAAPAPAADLSLIHISEPTRLLST